MVVVRPACFVYFSLVAISVPSKIIKTLANMCETENPGREALYEISNFIININKNEEGTCIWHNSTLAVRTPKGLHFYQLTHNIASLDKKINCIQTFLPTRKSEAPSKLFTDKVINSSMRNIDYTEMILDQTMWPHNPQLIDEMVSIVAFEWSPHGLLSNEESALAVMNNIGVVDLYINNQGKWIHKLEISSSFANTIQRQPREFVELKGIAHTLASTALCWAPNLVGDKCCYLVTAQKNETIRFWLVQHSDAGITADCQGSINNGVGEILAMKWMSLPDNKFILICSNIYGQIILFACTITNSNVENLSSHMIWEDKDLMISRYLQLITISDKIILVCNKHRHVLMLMIDKDFKVCGQFVHNMNDHRITCITNSRDEIYLTTVNTQVYKVVITMQDGKFDVNILLVEFKDTNPTSELYSMSFSENGVLCTMVTVDRKVTFRKDSIKINVVFATTQQKLDSLVSILLDNPTCKLTNYWDVVELLRYKCMKQKTAPSINYSDLYDKGCNNIYYLKLYLIFITFYTNLRSISKMRPLENIPEESVKTIKEEIQVIHAESQFRKLNVKRLAEGQLYGFDKEAFMGSFNFLDHYCKKNSRMLSDILNIDTSELNDLVCEYTCQGCDEQLQGFTCGNNHLNMFCSLTFTPIETNEYLACWWCNRTARIELLSDNPKCLICDLNLVVM